MEPSCGWHKHPSQGCKHKWKLASHWQRGQAEDAVEERVPRGMDTFRLTLSSEPDLLTAHTGHSVDVAQHWETDEASAGEEAAGL